jgi:hypothetical protein
VIILAVKGCSGIPFFLSRMMQDPGLPFIPDSRQWMAGYLVKQTTKFRYLVTILRKYVLCGDEKVIVVTKSPMPQYETECLSRVLSISTISIRAGMSSDERERLSEKFNDRNDPSRVLIGTYNTIGLGLNLHHACRTIVLLEPPVNINQ